MDRRLKVVAYVAIAVFSVLFTLLIALFVVQPLAVKNEIESIKHAAEAERFKQRADSVAMAVDITVDSIEWARHIDSLTYISQKELLKRNYITKVKKYESRLADIDTLDNIQLNGSFSVREMLSDSSGKLW